MPGFLFYERLLKADSTAKQQKEAGRGASDIRGVWNAIEEDGLWPIKDDGVASFGTKKKVAAGIVLDHAASVECRLVDGV